MSQNQRLQELKQKYSAVLTAMDQHGVELNQIDLQDGKLLLQGAAPSEQAKNRVWDQIKSVNPEWSEDLIADITIGPSSMGGTREGGLLDILRQYRDASPAAPPVSVERDYSAIARSVPRESLASGLTDAFRSNETPSFGNMIGSLFGNSNGQQRAGILTQLLGALGPGMLASGGLGSLAGLLRGSTHISPEQAERISPQDVQDLAERAEKHNPSIVDQAGEFYSQHPTLVQALGVGSLAYIMSRLYPKGS